MARMSLPQSSPTPCPYLFKITRACMVHGRRRRAWLSCTASTVLRATVSGFSGGKRLGNLTQEETTGVFSREASAPADRLRG